MPIQQTLHFSLDPFQCKRVALVPDRHIDDVRQPLLPRKQWLIQPPSPFIVRWFSHG
jgi:hypothetical protein